MNKLSNVVVSESKVVDNEKYTIVYISGLPYVVPREVYKKLNKVKEK